MVAWPRSDATAGDRLGTAESTFFRASCELARLVLGAAAAPRLETGFLRSEPAQKSFTTASAMTRSTLWPLFIIIGSCAGLLPRPWHVRGALPQPYTSIDVAQARRATRSGAQATRRVKRGGALHATPVGAGGGSGRARCRAGRVVGRTDRIGYRAHLIQSLSATRGSSAVTTGLDCDVCGWATKADCASSGTGARLDMR